MEGIFPIHIDMLCTKTNSLGTANMENMDC